MNFSFYFRFSDWNNFKTRDLPVNQSPKDEIASSFPTWRKFKLSETVGRKLLKRQAIYYSSFTISSFMKKCTCSVKNILHYVPCCSHYMMLFWYMSTVMLFINLLYSFIKEFIMFNILRFFIGTSVYLLQIYRLLLCMQDILIPSIIHSFFILFIILNWAGKQVSEIFTKVYRNNIYF
jgi:hypothetical protein